MERGTVTSFDPDEGWGVIAVDHGEVWVHYSVIDMDGYRTLTPGELVELEIETAAQDGFAYRATRVVPGAEL